MDDFDIKPVLESLFFVSDFPIRLETLVEILPESNKEAILEGIRQIQTEYEDRSKGIELTEIAGGYQFRTKPNWAGWVNRLKRAKAVKLSQAALETLAIVAYRQPVIRPAIEEIRGVDSGRISTRVSSRIGESETKNRLSNIGLTSKSSIILSSNLQFNLCLSITLIISSFLPRFSSG